MPNLFPSIFYDSPGDQDRRKRFARARTTALDALEPAAGAALTQEAGRTASVLQEAERLGGAGRVARGFAPTGARDLQALAFQAPADEDEEEFERRRLREGGRRGREFGAAIEDMTPGQRSRLALIDRTARARGIRPGEAVEALRTEQQAQPELTAGQASRAAVGGGGGGGFGPDVPSQAAGGGGGFGPADVSEPERERGVLVRTAVRKATALFQAGEIDEQQWQSIAQGQPDQSVIEALAQRGIQDEGDRALFELHKMNAEERLRGAPVLGALELPFHFAGKGAASVAEKLGGGKEAQLAANLTTQVGLGFATGRLPTKLLPGVVRTPVEATIAGSMSDVRRAPRVPLRPQPVEGVARGAPLETAAVRRPVQPATQPVGVGTADLSSAQTGRPLEGTFFRGESGEPLAAGVTPARGRFFATEPRTASGFAGEQFGARVSRERLSFRNPLVVDSRREAAEALGLTLGDDIRRADDAIARAARARGHDAVVYRQTDEVQALGAGAAGDVPADAPARAAPAPPARGAAPSTIRAAEELQELGVSPIGGGGGQRIRNTVSKVDEFAPDQPPPSAKAPTLPDPPEGHATRQLKSLDEFATDFEASTTNALGSLTRAVGKAPPLRGTIELLNKTPFLRGRLGATLGGYLRKRQAVDGYMTALETSMKERESRLFQFVDNIAAVKSKTGRLGTPEAIVLTPNEFVLTPAQRRFVNDSRKLLDDELAFEKVRGVKVGEIVGSGSMRGYFPREVVAVRGREAKGAVVRRAVGSTQRFQRNRYYGTMAEGMENGVEYGEGITNNVMNRVRSGQQAALDTEVVPVLRSYGVKPTERPSVLKLTRQQRKIARDMGKAEAAGDTAKVNQLQAEIDAVHAQRRIAVELGSRPGIEPAETFVPEPFAGGRIFPEEEGQLIRSVVGREGPTPGALKALEAINNISRPIATGADVGFMGLQFIPAIARNPAAGARGSMMTLDALITDSRLMARYVQRHLDDGTLVRFFDDGGIWNQSEFSFEFAAKNRGLQWLNKGPMARFNNSYNNSLNLLTLENYKGMVGVSDALNRVFGAHKASQMITRAFAGFGKIEGKNAGQQAASVSNKLTLRLAPTQLGIKGRQSTIETIMLWAPRYYRAAFGLLGDALQGGMRGAQARRSLAQMIGGVLLAYQTAAYLTGKEPDWTPGKGTFMTFLHNGQHVGLGGPFVSMAQVVARSAKNPDQLLSRSLDRNPLLRWGRGKGSPVASLMVDVIDGETFLGEKLDDPIDYINLVANRVTPFPIQAGREALEAGGGVAGAVTAGVSEFLLGARTFPQSKFELFKEAFKEETGIDYDGREGHRTIAKQNPRLRQMLEAADRDAQQRGLDFAVDRQEREEAIAGLAEELRPFAAGVRARNPQAGAAFLRAYSDFKTQRAGVFQRDFFGEEFPERNSPAGRALDELGEMSPNAAPYLDADPVAGTFAVDWDRWEADQERQLDIVDAAFPGFKKAYLERTFLPEEFADIERSAIEARQVRDQLGDISPVQGLTPEEYDQIRDFLRRVDQARDTWLQRDRVDVPLEDAVRAIAQHEGQSANFAGWAVAIRSAIPDELRNPEYDAFIQAHRAELRAFYPELFTRRILKLEAGIPLGDSGTGFVPGRPPARPSGAAQPSRSGARLAR